MNVLILLIGGNPLPNYITAKYLLTKGREDESDLPVPDKIVFVYSKSTEIFKKSIITQLALDEKQHVIPINLDANERDPETIMRRLREELHKFAPAASLHLNYTGGTKTMSVFSALTAMTYHWKQSNEGCIFLMSDLDPEKNRLAVMMQNVMSVAQPSFKRLPAKLDLREHIKIDVATLFALHGMNVKKPGTETLTLPTEKLYEFGKQAIVRYRAGRGKDIFRVFEEFEKDLKTIKRLNKTEDAQEQAISKNQNIRNALDQIYVDFPYAKKCFTYLQQNMTRPYAMFIEFFTGKWVEEVVLHVLQQLQTKQAIPVHELKKGVEAEFNGRPCEIDVITIRGYQLFLCSCTTSQDIKYVKQKAFEAIYRAEELGGEHAKTIVISTMYNKTDGRSESFADNNNLKQLEKDLQQFDAKRNCSLIGLDELEDELRKGPQQEGKLSQRLRTIITQG